MVGDDINEPHMVRAREAILASGGAVRCNVFTRFALALFEQVPWRAVPVMRVEMIFAPRWFPINIWKMSYWSRTVSVPLLVLATLKPKARNPRRVHVQELFTTPRSEKDYALKNPTGHWLGDLLLFLDKMGRLVEPLFPKSTEKRAISKAIEFVTERLNGKDGVGGIFPAMVNTLMAFDALEYPKDHPDRAIVRASINGLIVEKAEDAYCQPCFSPVWDTCLAMHSVMEAGTPGADPVLEKASQWMLDREITEFKGDWKEMRPDAPAGGWAFQYLNEHYPDVDDTAVVAMALDRADRQKYRGSIGRAAAWIVEMQCENGGWGAFDAENDYYFVENIPFADHGAMLDPPTVDVTARCLSFLLQIGRPLEHPAVARGLAYLRREQEEDGSWFGRWGTNYVYGTWSALCAFNAAGEDMTSPHMVKAVKWLKSRQRADGGWGEDCASYWANRKEEVKSSTASQTSWALLGLMAAGEIDSEEVDNGIHYLSDAPRDGSKWHEDYYNAVGFPCVFYLRYHGYSEYFPLWALSRYRNLKDANAKTPIYGI
jgi:squalene-hopene/tetraprenyl-beta-curcumene cyclase